MREKGTVKWFDDMKGFGFIMRDTGGRDVFVHQKEVQMEGFRSLDADARVEFEIVEDLKGPRAVNVTLLS
jgi:CspA family cold shock protein